MVKGPLAAFKGLRRGRVRREGDGKLRKHIISFPENALKGSLKRDRVDLTMQCRDLNNFTIILE